MLARYKHQSINPPKVGKERHKYHLASNRLTVRAIGLYCLQMEHASQQIIERRLSKLYQCQENRLMIYMNTPRRTKTSEQPNQ